MTFIFSPVRSLIAHCPKNDSRPAGGRSNLPLGLVQRPFGALDPSAGIEHFKSMTLSTLRDQADWIEIKLDGLTTISQTVLPPNSRIFNSGFEAANPSSEMFDLALSNCPFGECGVISKKLPSRLTNSIGDFIFANA